MKRLEICQHAIEYLFTFLYVFQPFSPIVPAISRLKRAKAIGSPVHACFWIPPCMISEYQSIHVYINEMPFYIFSKTKPAASTVWLTSSEAFTKNSDSTAKSLQRITKAKSRGRSWWGRSAWFPTTTLAERRTRIPRETRWGLWPTQLFFSPAKLRSKSQPWQLISGTRSYLRQPREARHRGEERIATFERKSRRRWTSSQDRGSLCGIRRRVVSGSRGTVERELASEQLNFCAVTAFETIHVVVIQTFVSDLEITHHQNNLQCRQHDIRRNHQHTFNT